MSLLLHATVGVGVSIPHRSGAPISPDDVAAVAVRAEERGFTDLWVTDNTLSAPSREFSLDPFTVLSYTAAVTTQIGLGVAVLVLPVRHPVHVAHQIASLDYLSGGRAALAVGIGRDFNYVQFQVPSERRVRRFLDGVAVMRSLWSQTPVKVETETYRLTEAGMLPKPVQAPFPLWFGGTHPDAVRRAARYADGWIGSGGQSIAAFAESVRILRSALEQAGRAPGFPVSKRVFVAVDDKPQAARRELDRWFQRDGRADASGVYGTVEQVRQRLFDLAGMGASHLLLNATARYAEHVDALAEVAGL